MIHADLKNLKSNKNKSDLIIYEEAIIEYLENNHINQKNSNKPIILNVDEMNKLIPFELKIVDNITQNHKETHTLIKQIVETWSEKYRDVFYTYNNTTTIPQIKLSNITHHEENTLFRVKATIEGYQNFVFVPIVWYFICPICGKEMKALFNIRINCKCGRNSIKSYRQDYESRMYFQIAEITQEGEPASSMNCFFTISKQKYNTNPFNTRLVGESVEMVCSVFINEKKNKSELEHEAYLEFKGCKIITNQKVKPERKKEIIDTVKSLGLEAFHELAYAMTKNVYGHEFIRQADFCCAIGLQKPDPDFGDDINTALNLGKVGDPSVGKTYSSKQFLKYFPKASYMQGSSTTKVGLLGGVDRHKDMGFIVKTGQVSKSTNSFLILDEVDKMPEEQTKGLFTAMSEGKHTLTNITGKTEYSYNTSFILIANPKHSKFDARFSKYSQIDLDSAFLSRIDLLMLVEKPYLKDGEINQKMYEEYSQFRTKRKTYPAKFDEQFLKEYATIVKQTSNPKLDDNIKKVMENYVTKIIFAQDNAIKNNYADTDIKHIDERFFNTLVKLSKIIARTIFSETVKPEHFNKAVELLEETSLKPFMEMMKSDGLTGAIDMIDVSQAKRVPTSTQGVKNWIQSFIRQRLRQKIKDGEEALVDWSEILKEGMSLGLTESQIEDNIEKQKKIGELTENRPNKFRVAGESLPIVEEEKIEEDGTQ